MKQALALGIRELSKKPSKSPVSLEAVFRQLSRSHRSPPLPRGGSDLHFPNGHAPPPDTCLP